VAQDLDRGQELVEVDMEHPAGHATQCAVRVDRIEEYLQANLKERAP
jgi:hypothetical protein